MFTRLTAVFSQIEIPHGVRVLTTTTGIRWFGWGFAETLIPVFLFSFGNSFAEAGLLKASVDITFILSLPIIGIYADKVRATTLIAVGYFLYIFVGLGYFLAGTTGLVVFVVLARLINGFGWGLDVVGRDTYFRRHVPINKVATTFGYFDTIANLWWVSAALGSILLVSYFSIPELLFLITPTSIISFLLLLRFRRKEEKNHVVGLQKESLNILAEIKSWNLMLKGILGFNFLITFTGAVVAFFLPIEVYKEGGSLIPVILMGIVYTLPTLAGWSLGKLFDAKGYKLLNMSLIVFALLLLSLSFFTSFFWRLLVMFVVSMILELISVGSNELVSASAKPEHFGRVDGILKSTASVGGMVGPFAIGILMDATSASSAYISLSVAVFALAILFKVFEKKGFIDQYLRTSR